jgi:maltose alpha-D-glucosyltransferase/alpha-amylase
MRAHAGVSLDLLAGRLASLDEVSRGQAEAVLAARDAVLARFEAIRALDDAGQRIRIHRDYHLGQVLRTEEDFVILDFEGDPAQSMAERRAKQSPLKDVAGMIRSYGYAAYAALFAFGVHTPDDYAALEPWAGTWEHWAAYAFLKGYTAVIDDTPLLPRDAGARCALLSAFALDKALRELGYELHNRPDWVRVPLVGVHKLIRPIDSILRSEKRLWQNAHHHARKPATTRHRRLNRKRGARAPQSYPYPNQASTTSVAARTSAIWSAAAITASISTTGSKLNGN